MRKILSDRSFKSIFSKFLIVVAVALLYVGAVWYYRRTQTEVAQNSETSVPNSPNEEQDSGQFKNGTYSAEGNYISPGGTEQVNVTLTLANDLVADAEVTALASVPVSDFFQKDFIANYKAQVVGKSISDLNLTKVSGSSLTPKGFNDAVAKIKTQAQF